MIKTKKNNKNLEKTKDKEIFFRLNSYFHALENDQLKQYHDQREKNKQNNQRRIL
jgi:hypothetical protein